MKRRKVGLIVVSVLALVAAVVTVAGVRAGQRGDLLAGSPWIATSKTEMFTEALGDRWHKVSYQLEGVDPKEVIDYYSKRFPESDGWRRIPFPDKKFLILERGQAKPSVPAESVLVQADNHEAIVGYTEPFDVSQYIFALVRSGGRARIVDATTGKTRVLP